MKIRYYAVILAIITALLIPLSAPHVMSVMEGQPPDLISFTIWSYVSSNSELESGYLGQRGKQTVGIINVSHPPEIPDNIVPIRLLIDLNTVEYGEVGGWIVKDVALWIHLDEEGSIRKQIEMIVYWWDDGDISSDANWGDQPLRPRRPTDEWETIDPTKAVEIARFSSDPPLGKWYKITSWTSGKPSGVLIVMAADEFDIADESCDGCQYYPSKGARYTSMIDSGLEVEYDWVPSNGDNDENDIPPPTPPSTENYEPYYPYIVADGNDYDVEETAGVTKYFIVNMEIIIIILIAIVIEFIVLYGMTKSKKGWKW